MAVARESQIESASYAGISKTEEGFLKFESREAYDAVLDIMKDYNPDQFATWESQLSFESLRKLHTEGREVDGDRNANLDDSLLSTFINAHGIFQVGKYIFKMSCDDKYLLTLNENDKSDYLSSLEQDEFVPAVMLALKKRTFSSGWQMG